MIVRILVPEKTNKKNFNWFDISVEKGCVIMLHLSGHDKENIAGMLPECENYAVSPDDFPTEEFNKVLHEFKEKYKGK